MMKWIVIMVLVIGALLLFFEPPVFVETFNTPYSEGWKAKPAR